MEKKQENKTVKKWRQTMMHGGICEAQIFFTKELTTDWEMQE